jgi:hypothetical protein
VVLLPGVDQSGAWQAQERVQRRLCIKHGAVAADVGGRSSSAIALSKWMRGSSWGVAANVRGCGSNFGSAVAWHGASAAVVWL